MILRQCLVTPIEGMTAVRKDDGSWTLEGSPSEESLASMLLMERFGRPFNSTFYATSENDECLQRIVNNQSDFVNYLMPLQTISDDYHAQIPLFIGQTQFIAGFKSIEGKGGAKDTATVFTNADLLQLPVYLWALFTVISLVLFVCIRVFMFHREMPRCSLIQRRTTLTQRIGGELSGVFYYSSHHFKLITLLYSLLCFYLVTSFLCLYKTSHIIAENPFYPKTYEQSLRDETSLLLYYDQFAAVSNGFRDASVGSVKRKLWDKLMASSRKDDIFSRDKDAAQLAITLKKFASGILNSRDIAAASSVMIGILKSFACGLSSEDELYFLRILSDPSEAELITSTVFSKRFAGVRTLERSYRRGSESHIVIHHYMLTTDVSYISFEIAGTSRNHQWRQHLACTSPEALEQQVDVHGIPLSYFHSFFVACVSVWAVASLVNLCEILFGAKNEKRRLHPH